MRGLGKKIKAVGLVFVVSAAMLVSLPGLGSAKETVKLAFIGPLTGGVSATGMGGRNSAELAVKLRNLKKNSKYEYELVSMDDECKPNVGVQVATRIASDKKIIGAVTHYCSAVALSTVKIYHRFDLPAVVWGAVHPDITYGNSYKEIFRVNGTMINQNQVAANFMTGQGYKKFAIINDTTDYGKAHKKYFSKFIKENGGEILDSFGVTSDQQDFTAELTKIKKLEPEVIYFGGLTPLGVRIRSQMNKLGIKAQFEGVSGIKSDAYIDGLGSKLAEGTLSFIEGAPREKLPGGAFFSAEYKKAQFDQDHEAYGPFAFAAMNILMDTIEKVGPKRKAVVKAMNSGEEYNGIIGKVRFDDHGQNEIAVISKYIVQDGKWVLWEDSEYASGKRSLVK